MTTSKSNVIPMGAAELDPGVREQIQRLLGAGTITQAQICRESGLTAGQVSPWLQEKYKGDSRAVEDKLRQWLEARERKAALIHTLPMAPPWMETPIARRIVSVLAYSQMAGDIGCIYGGAGLGKSITLKAYADSNPNVWVVEMTTITCAPGSALEEIAAVVGVGGGAGRPVMLQRGLIKKLRDTGGLLVIDEAQHLRTAALEAIRAIHDATGIGLVLCGNDSVYARLTGGGQREATFAQLFSRLGKRLRLTRPSKGDVEQVAGHYISSAEALALAAEIASKPGALRGMVKTLRLAAMFAAGEGAELGADHIRAAWRDLGGQE